MDQELKREILLDNYSNPFHKETKDGFLKANANNISCIDDINVFIKIEDNKIVDAYFDGEACAISTASTSIMIKKIIGMTIEEARKYIENFDNMVNEKEYDKENPAIKAAALFNKQKLTILRELDLRTDTVPPPDESGGNL